MHVLHCVCTYIYMHIYTHVYTYICMYLDVHLIIVAFLYLKGAFKKDGERLFTRACRDGTRQNGFKLIESRFGFDIRRNSSLWRCWGPGNGCPDSPVCPITGSIEYSIFRREECFDLSKKSDEMHKLLASKSIIIKLKTWILQFSKICPCCGCFLHLNLNVGKRRFPISYYTCYLLSISLKRYFDKMDNDQVASLVMGRNSFNSVFQCTFLPKAITSAVGWYPCQCSQLLSTDNSPLSFQWQVPPGSFCTCDSCWYTHRMLKAMTDRKKISKWIEQIFFISWLGGRNNVNLT